MRDDDGGSRISPPQTERISKIAFRWASPSFFCLLYAPKGFDEDLLSFGNGGFCERIGCCGKVAAMQRSNPRVELERRVFGAESDETSQESVLVIVHRGLSGRDNRMPVRQPLIRDDGR
ncbi:hypothetical protein MOTC310_19230 [Methylobacterium oryzae]|uniref:Uncharacterized protein n=1 Tax=Methylobacterium oryzae TaxID=334852 RepID=A0ABU7TTI4_9HYPH